MIQRQARLCGVKFQIRETVFLSIADGHGQQLLGNSLSAELRFGIYVKNSSEFSCDHAGIRRHPGSEQQNNSCQSSACFCHISGQITVKVVPEIIGELTADRRLLSVWKYLKVISVYYSTEPWRRNGSGALFCQ